MKKRFYSLLFSLLLCGNLVSSASVSITGKNRVQTGDTTEYSVNPETDIISYVWKAPKGCRIIDGQGSPTIKLASTFLSQDSPLTLIREKNDNSTDTSSIDISFVHRIARISDHSISAGDSISINGNYYKDADIYYEPLSDGDGEYQQVTAHRLTVVPDTFSAFTKPYLQSVTSSSIWISWKSDKAGIPVVLYGTDAENLSFRKEGSYEQLSDSYFWNSVQLTGLEAETFYYYKVVFNDEESDVYRFRTMQEKGDRKPMRILLMGDHQIKSRSGYEWLMKAAQRKIEEKYGKLEENIDMIMNIGDQVDLGTLEQYEHIHLFKSQLMSPYLPIMTAVGNHETYQDPGMAHYAAHYHYEDLEYNGIKSGTENYYAYQAGRILFIVLSTEHTGDTQKAWVRKVIDTAKNDDSVDFIISVNHRPIQAEQYIGDISSWVRNEIIPILSETPKHVFNYGGHHHLYHRGQLTDYPVYHIINGAASWDQMWGMSSEKDYDDVQKTIDYWGYQILEFDFERKEMKAECYAIGNKELVVDNILIDSFHRILGKAAPQKPEIAETPDTISLPYMFKGSPYYTSTDEVLNSVQFQFSLSPDFSTLELDKVQDVENLYGSTGSPWHTPIDLNEGKDITCFTVEKNKLKNGVYYIRTRYRDANMEWSEWSESRKFTVTGSIDGDPSISMEKNTFAPGEKIEVLYQYAPEGQNAWIGIYHKGKNPDVSGPSTRWEYTSGQSGKFTFTLDSPDEYYAVLFNDEGYTEISERIAFYVGSIPELSIEKSSYQEGEGIKVNFKNAPGLDNDWIGIYKMGKIPGTADLSDSWDYTGKQNSGEMTLGKELGKGYYFVNYFTRGEYFEPRERLYFSIGDKISSVWAEKDTFDIDEEIHIHYQDGPGTPKDWVGFFLEGKDPNKDELDGFYYTYGATEGYITVKPGELPAGKYFCALYINDSYDEVSERIYITISDKSANRIETEKESLSYMLSGGVLSLQNNGYDTAEIFQTTGKRVIHTSLVSGNNRIDMNDLENGLYILRVSDKEKARSYKIILNK